jgi:hypothetical protein
VGWLYEQGMDITEVREDTQKVLQFAANIISDLPKKGLYLPACSRGWACISLLIQGEGLASAYQLTKGLKLYLFVCLSAAGGCRAGYPL